MAFAPSATAPSGRSDTFLGKRGAPLRRLGAALLVFGLVCLLIPVAWIAVTLGPAMNAFGDSPGGGLSQGPIVSAPVTPAAVIAQLFVAFLIALAAVAIGLSITCLGAVALWIGLKPTVPGYS